jgi:hypothetical protein
MKRYLTLILLTMIGYAASAQKYNKAERQYLSIQDSLAKTCPDTDCKTKPPMTLIWGSTVKVRIANYKRRMRRAGLPAAGDVPNNIEGAIALLTIMLNRTKNYEGFRAYFAMYPDAQQPKTPDSGYTLVPDNLWGRLTLIYVPTNPGGTYTSPQDHKTYQRHIDDDANCMIIFDNTVKLVPKDIAKMWVHKAECNLLDTLDNFRHKKHHPKFNETHALWYDMNYVRGDCSGENNLLHILCCKQKCGVKHVYVKFAAYLTRYHHQLTVVFQLDEGKNNEYLTLYSRDMSKRERNEFANCYGLAASGSGGSGSDTGNPCPPPNPCNLTTAGASLPSKQ